MDVLGWLRNLGLEQYEAAFCDNHIDAALLSSLTNEDLKEIGVASLGHRRKLLEAIAVLRSRDSEREAAVAGHEAERRQLTLMFCDLVGSTPLASRFDPEDLSEIIGVYHRTVTAEIERYDGFVARYMGDGVLSYFGYPQAHEDDAERAVRAGLSAIGAVGRLDLPERLLVRVGIATGLVVVGELIGKGAAQERDVVGETPNLAARLQALAAPNSLIVADATRRQLGALFKVEDLGARQLAGFAELQHCWRVVGESGVVNRFEALRSGTTPLVGREEELDQLLDAWRQAKTGEGQVVLVSGEPGIGKSRLVAEAVERLEPESHIRLRYFCSPHHQDSALYPIIVQLERAAGFTRDDTAEQKREKLDVLLGPAAESADEIELIAKLLSLWNSAADLNLTPQRQRQLLLEGLVHQLEGHALERPVLMLFEDAHWSDATSRELLGLTIDRMKNLPIALLVTYRPEFEPPWGARPYLRALTLNRLSGYEGVTLVENLAGDRSLSSDVIDEIIDRTDGVPLFIEELTNAVLESDDRPDRLASVLAASPTPALAVPATLHASLISRLDRLGTAAKEVAQIGAVLGREFSHELISQVARRPDLDTALGQLTHAGLLFCRGLPPASYLFKHALVQDAAYGTLLRRRRQQLHGRIAAALEQEFADLVERQPELLAHHLSGARDTKRAVGQWLKAGQYAAAHSAHIEAIAHLERGLALLPSLPDTAERDSLEIELQLALGMSGIRAKGMISPTVRDAYSRASELAEKHGHEQRLFQSLYGMFLHNLSLGQLRSGRPLTEQLLRVTERETDIGLRLQAHHATWTHALYGGEPERCRAHCEAGLQLYDRELHRSHREIYAGHDPGVCGSMLGAQAKWLLGYPDAALASLAEGIVLAEQISHLPTLIGILNYAVLLRVHRREPDLALVHLNRAEALAVEQRISLILSPRILRGAAHLARGEVHDAITCLREGLPGGRTAGGARPLAVCLLGEALARQGEYAQASRAISEALQTEEATGQGLWNAELHRAYGLVLLAQNQLAESEACFNNALQVARDQQAKSWELRAATSLARMWGEQGRRAEAHELLAPVYGWFTEGFDTPDLKDAKALLDDVT